MSDGLVEFLRARLDEDEQIARRACEYAEAEWRLDEEFGETVLWWPPEPHIAEKEREKGLPVVSDQWRGQTIDSRIAPHVARHDPARVLREIDAKRETVHWHLHEECCSVCLDDVEGCPLFRALATPYADHPDYREGWRP
ncbi:DUF6221 family protein [Streptomyces sp. 5-6(2022)]|uniref:DUF6221 family protein n=1 Tax=Streptomyces sp. 5-6(2022) TaxID=2936510 RepID=UPI0023BA3901|nr:DUF6221 family protein [Streptomyces sp. 5-6(2022)]